ncbi:MAG: hypothetical protein JXN65_07010 [Clostridia bacterium]|nr:hypothetical protein [Clostridia bacterium]
MAPIADFTKIDLHVHTRATFGSSISLKNIEDFLKKNPDFGLAITDVNSIENAALLKAKYPEKIIVGSQIITRQGAVTGLFLKEPVPSGRDINWTIDAIIVQDGLVYIPHPLDGARKNVLDAASLNLALKRCDIIEIFNSRTIYSDDNKKAINLLSSDIIPACGSDAHTIGELGQTYMEISRGTGLNSSDFLAALKYAELICKKASTASLLRTKLYIKYNKIFKKQVK